MPLDMRIVEPFRLGRKPLMPEDCDEGPRAERAVIHNAVLGAMLQLTSLIRHADDIFCDLIDECQKISDKSERIKRKLDNIGDLTGKLDSKTVSVPVGDLKKFSSVPDHHTAYHGFDCHMFTKDSRPQCIKDQYSLADITPASVLRGADEYRKDGLYSSLLFKLWPVFRGEDKVKLPDISMPKRPVVSFQKDYKKLKIRERPKTIALDDLNISQSHEDDAEEAQLSPTKTPSTVVIDTSGSGFHRMCSFRESLKSDKGKSRRRRTVTGVSDSIMQEIYVFEKEKRIGGRHQPRSYSFDDLDAEDDVKRDEIMAQYFHEIDAKYEEALEEETASKQSRYLKFIPCRRSRSLPRNIKTRQRSTSRDHRMSTSASSYASTLNLSQSATSITSSRFSRSTKRSSIIGNKIKSMVQNVSSSVTRSRPKSLDLDALDFTPDPAPSPARARSTAHIPLTNSMPDGMASVASGSESSIGPGTYYYFESNTIPKAQAKKYDFPWESLPKDWTTAVKLREISKRRPREDRQSSSGHWSASSCSNRQSLESGKSSMPSSYSAYSLGRDSGRGSPSPSEHRHGLETFSSKDTRPATIHEPQVKQDDVSTELDTDAWLKSLASRAASRVEISKDDADTLCKLTRQNILALDLMSPDLNQQEKLDDEFSEFSVDQDGFYTSFHMDSGLKRSKDNLAEDDEDGSISPTKDFSNIFSMGSTNTIDSVIFRPTSGPGMSKGSILKRVPPPPPRRTCSVSSISVPISESTFAVGEKSGSGSDGSSVSLNNPEKADGRKHDSSFSESDQETIYARLKSKTQVSTSLAYPSWCSVSPSDSGEEIRASPSTSESKILLEEEGEESKEHTESNHSGNTLSKTRKYLKKKTWDEDVDFANSWPRSQKTGILKSDNFTGEEKKPSSFDAVNGLESQESSWSSSFADSKEVSSYKLAIPFMDDELLPNHQESLPIKYQPTITVTPKGRSTNTLRYSTEQKSSLSKPTTRPLSSTSTNHYAVGNLKGVKITAPSEISASSLSIPSLQGDDGGYLDMSSSLKNRSTGNLSSSSSLALSDIDDVVTYVSMSSPFSTPKNSTLTLEQDSANCSQTTVKPKMDTYRVSSALLAAAAGENIKDINSNSITLNSSHKYITDASKHHHKFGRSTSVQSPALSRPSFTHQSSAPSSISPSVIIVNDTQGSPPYSDTWPSKGRSSKSSYMYSETPDRPRSKSQIEDKSQNSSGSYRTDSYRVAMRNEADSGGKIHDLMPTSTETPNSRRRSAGPLESTPKDTDGYNARRRSSGSSGTPKSSKSDKSTTSNSEFVRRRSSGSVKSESSSPRTPEYDSNVSRADSYRMAVRKTNGVVSPADAFGRNSSYRVAITDDTTDTSKLMPMTLDVGNRKDNRRRGITDIDQLKEFSNDESYRKKSSSNLFATINSSKKRMNVKSEIESILRPNSSPSPEASRSSKSPKSPKSPKSDKNKNKEHRSSTYIRFDPIFEDKEDFLNSSSDTTRASQTSLNRSGATDASSIAFSPRDSDPLLGQKLSHPLPVKQSSRTSLSSRKADDKTSIFGSIKSTIKSISNKRGESDDERKFGTGCESLV